MVKSKKQLKRKEYNFKNISVRVLPRYKNPITISSPRQEYSLREIKALYRILGVIL